MNFEVMCYAIDYNESFGDSDIQALLEQWNDEEEEKSQID